MPGKAPEPQSLPVNPGWPARTQRVNALLIAHQAGMLTYVEVDEDAQIYHVVLSDGRHRYLNGDEVLGWLLGYADASGQAAVARIAYRDGLI